MWFELENGHYINLDNISDVSEFTYFVVGDTKPHRWTKTDFKHWYSAVKKKGRLAVYDK